MKRRFTSPHETACATRSAVNSTNQSLKLKSKPLMNPTKITFQITLSDLSILLEIIYSDNINTMETQGAPPKNWLVESILVTILCCLPLGIVGIINSANVNSKWAAGDYEGAEHSAAEAKKWTKIGFFVGIIGIVAYVVVVLVTGAGALFLGSQ